MQDDSIEEVQQINVNYPEISEFLGSIGLQKYIGKFIESDIVSLK